MVALAFYIIIFNEELRDTLLFKKQFNELKEILQIYFIIFIQLYKLGLIIVHFSNIFSIIRIIEICKNKNKNKKKNNMDSTSILFKSFLYIFFDILVLTPGYIFILILPPVFISTHINICKKIKNQQNNEYLFPNYEIIKNQILNDIIKIIIYFLAIILTILSIPFIWKFYTFFSILLELFKTNEYNTFFINYFSFF